MKRSKQELIQRWNAEEGRKAYAVILENINKGEQGRDIIEEALRHLPYSKELPIFHTRKGKPYQLSDFRGIDFSDQDLSNADLSYGQLDEAKFDNCRLDNVYFFASNVPNGSMKKVKGKKAWIHGVFLDNVVLDHSLFYDTEFNISIKNTSIKNAYFKDCTITCLNSENLDFEGTVFENTSLFLQNSGLKDEQEESIIWIGLNEVTFKGISSIGIRGKWQEIYFNKASLLDLDFSGYAIQGSDPLQNASFRGSILKNVNFESIDLKGADFENAILEDASFLNAGLQNVNFQGANLQNVNFQGANLQGSDFTNANTQGANFMGAEF